MMQMTHSAADWPTLATSLPGPESLSALTDSEVATLTPAHLLDAITCSERLLSHIAGMQTTLLTEFAQPGRAGDITRIVNTLTDVGSAAHTANGTLDQDLLYVLVTDHARGMAAAEVAAALHISPITARGRVEKAIDLHDGLPATHQALTKGLIDRGRAAVIAEHTDILDPETRSQVEEIVLPLAYGRTAGRLRPIIDRAVIIADPEAADRRVKKALKGREVTHRPLKDQLSLIKAILPADGAVTVFTLIDLLAGKKVKGDERVIGERRADALSDLCKKLLTHGLVDLRGLLETPDDQDDLDHLDDPFIDDDLDGDETVDDFSDPADNPNGPVTSNCDWDDDVETGSAAPAPVADSDCDTDTDTDTDSNIEETLNSCPAPSLSSRATDLTAHATHTGVEVGGDADTDGTWDHALPGIECAAARGSKDTSGPVKTTASPLPPTDSRRLLSRQGRRPHLTLTMSLSTLMALDRLPGHLEGYGAVTAELAEAIKDCAASLNIVIIDPATGHPMQASGREHYRPRQHHRDIAGTMAENCRFPSCRQPVWKCDLDHREAYNHRSPDLGGPTDPCNLDPLCRRHHLMKHHSDWSPQRQQDGTMKWTSPTNHTYIDPPREITLPGELLMPTQNPRTNIGIADVEHQTNCTAMSSEATERPSAISRSYVIRLAEREALHQRSLQRRANLRRQQIDESSNGRTSTARQSWGVPWRTNNEAFNSSTSNSDDPNHEYSEHEYSISDQMHFDEHPAWTLVNIPKTVAELRARSGYTTALADDEEPPF